MLNNKNIPEIGQIWCFGNEKFLVIDIVTEQEETYINFACLDSHDFGVFYGDYELKQMQNRLWKKLV